MSSADEDNATNPKKRKLQRACDYCRRKKSDGFERPDDRCSRCQQRRIECTYNEPHWKSSYPSSYVDKLESRLERMERLLNKLCPEADILTTFEGHVPEGGSTTRTALSEGSRASSSRLEAPSTLSSLPMTPRVTVGVSPENAPLTDHEEGLDEGLIEGLCKLSVSPQPYRYHGKSSGLVLIQTAIEMGNQQPGRPSQVEPQERAPYRHPWLRPVNIPSFRADDFPPDDLIDSLVDLYFRKLNDMLPLLHEPTFHAGINDGLHLRDGGFGATVLLVCANAARFTNDPRVLLDGTDDKKSAGWKWFQAVEDWRKVSSSLAPARLHDLQICVLMANFLVSSNAPQANWTLIGGGIRMAVDVGAHRRKMYHRRSTIEDELWRRAFWILVLLDWSLSYGLGRPASIQDDDIDAALPTEVDDEYWTSCNSNGPLRQPREKPSKVSYLVAHIRLARNLTLASKTVYSLHRSKLQLGQSDSQWEQRVVAELDSSLNNWLDSLPAHLRWNPDQTNPLFLAQSATLYANYYHTQIAVHRPSASRHDSPLPSVIICANAARSCIQTLDVLYRRTGNPYHKNAGLLFMCGTVLMMHARGQKQAGRLADVDRDISVLRRAILMLESVENEMQISSALRSLLEKLILAVNNLPHRSTESTTLRGSTGIPTALTTPNTSPLVDVPAAMPQQSSTQLCPGSTTAEIISQQDLPSRTGHPEFTNVGEYTTTSGLGIPIEDSAPNAFMNVFGFDQHAMSQAQSEDMVSRGELGNAAMSDFAFMDDIFSMWTNVPSSFTSDEWGEYLQSGANGGDGFGPA